MTLATEYFDYRRFTEGAEVSLGTKVVQYIHNTGGERGQIGPLHGTLRGSGTPVYHWPGCGWPALPCASGIC